MSGRLRVFQAIAKRSTTIANEVWYKNLYEPLVDIGCDVYLFDITDFLSLKPGQMAARLTESLRREFLGEHKKKPFDLFFTYVTDKMIIPEMVSDIRRLGVPTMNFSCNNVHQFHVIEKISPYYDYNCHAERDVADKFRAIGANPVWFPMAANPKYYRRFNLPLSEDVTFVGQNYAKRSRYVWYLLENGVKVNVYGPGWRLKREHPVLRQVAREFRRAKLALKTLTCGSSMRAYLSAVLAQQDFDNRLRLKYGSYLHQPLSDTDMIKKFSTGKVSLGFLEVYDRHRLDGLPLPHIHLREFEVPMCGALYVTGYSDELAEHYEIDKEVITYGNEYELLEKVRYFLSHEAQAQKIRENAYRRAHSCHTYQQRFKQLFREIGLKAGTIPAGARQTV